MPHRGRAEHLRKVVPDLDKEPGTIGQQAHPEQRQLARPVIPGIPVRSRRRPDHVGGQFCDEQFGDLCQPGQAPSFEHNPDETAGEAGRCRQRPQRAEIRNQRPVSHDRSGYSDSGAATVTVTTVPGTRSPSGLIAMIVPAGTCPITDHSTFGMRPAWRNCRTTGRACCPMSRASITNVTDSLTCHRPLSSSGARGARHCRTAGQRRTAQVPAHGARPGLRARVMPHMDNASAR